jgi:glycosyltransferase involved in cell wall biosynthesis
MPSVSIIIPCYNEQSTICLLLGALYGQTYPRQEIEVVIADGLSSDGTRAEIASFQQEHPDFLIRVVDNPRRNIPSGLNCAIAAAQGRFIVRLDAHSIPRPDYVARCVSALEQGLGDNVGGVWDIRPQRQDWLARSIAVAAAHPFGVGDARYRYTEQAQAVDTVPFGAYRRELVERIGPYDERLLTNEDYEFNTRIRMAGGVIWLDPSIRSIYFARPTLSELARQYGRYGYWKARMLRRYPAAIRLRQALPPAFVLSLLVFGVMAVWIPLVRWIIVIELASYALILFLAGIQMTLKNRDISLLIGVPLAIATMHFAWGSAFLWSVLAR